MEVEVELVVALGVVVTEDACSSSRRGEWE